jgi:putative methionine-R-sulfoxide reductase with GAF domain
MTKTRSFVQGRKARTLLAIAFAVLSAMVLVIAGSVQLYLNFQAQRQLVAEQQQLIAREAANTVASFVEKKFSELYAAAKLGIPISASSEEQQASLNNLLGLDSAFRHVALLDLEGQELAQATRLSQFTAGQLSERVSRDMLAQVREGHQQIGPVYIDDTTNEPLIVMAVPVTNVFGDPQGILLAEVNLKFMWDLVEQLKVGESGLAYVVNNQGDLLAFSDISRVLRSENVSDLSQVNEFVSNPVHADEAGVGNFKGITGVSVIGAYAPLGTPDWAVMTELPILEAYQPIFRSGLLASAGNLIMAILAGLLGYIVAGRLSKPILDLTQTATRIAAGEMELRVPAVGPAEIISLAQAFNSMTTQVHELIGGMETRTRALETSTQVSRRLSTILDREQLVGEVVKQVQNAFDYYHAHIYLTDEATRDLVLTSGTGEAGQIMLAGGHRIPWGKGLTGRAAATNSVILVPDVAKEEGWLPNPLLPDTKSEIAVPIALGEHVLGVLDVQHNVVGGLGATDADMLQSIANQVAIALQNASMFTEAQQRAEHQALVNIINQRIQSTASVENALQVAITELGRALGTQRATVQLQSISDEVRANQ